MYVCVCVYVHTQTHTNIYVYMSMHVLQYANVSIHVYKRFLSLFHENRGTPSALAPPGVPGRVWRRGGGRPGRGATSRPAAPAPPGLPPRAVPRGTRGCHEGTTVLVLVGTRQRVTPRLRWLPSSLRSGSVSGCASPRLRLRALHPPSCPPSSAWNSGGALRMPAVP